jgi:uncharacterized membrane protein
MDNIVVVRFAEPSKAYQALSTLKQAHAAGRLTLNQAGIVERTREGVLRVAEGRDNLAGTGMAAGSLGGMMVGILGGPLGMLLGWGTGALIGGAFDARRDSFSETALAEFGRSIEPGGIALIADLREPAVEVLNSEMQKLGGEVHRRPTNEVLLEVEAAQDAALAAAQQAERVMHEQRKKEREGRREERIEALKAKLQQINEAVRSL